MTIFEAVKTTVAPRMAAEHFGLSVSRNGMVCCPFHDDRHPSMKLYEDHYRSGGAETEGVSARQVKTGKKFVRRRNDSAKPCCSESNTGFTDAHGFARFPAKSRGSGKSIPLTYEEGIARRFSSRFQENRILHHTAKQVFGNANLLCCFHHENLGGFYEHQK